MLIEFCFSFAPTFRDISVQILDHRSPPGVTDDWAVDINDWPFFSSLSYVLLIDCTGAGQSFACESAHMGLILYSNPMRMRMRLRFEDSVDWHWHAPIIF